MSLDPTKQLAQVLADMSNEQVVIKQNMSGNEDDSQLQLAFSESLVATGSFTATKYLYPTNSFVINHPVYGNIDSATLLIDGGYTGYSPAAPSNCVAFYKLSDLADSISSYTLSNINSVTFSAGLIGNCANFNAASTQSLTTTSNLGIDGSACTLSCWLNVTALPGVGNAFGILDLESVTSHVGYQLYLLNSGGTQSIVIDRVKRGVASGATSYVASLSTSAWHSLIYTYDGSNTKLYVDGVYRATAASSGSGSTGGATGFYIGTIFEGYPLTGKIDAVGIWSRALTDGGVSLNATATGEIATIYNAGAGREYPGSTGTSTLLYSTTF